MSLQPNTQFGQYRLARLLGRGGMGEVYEAEHRVLHRRYALKLLPEDFASRAGAHLAGTTAGPAPQAGGAGCQPADLSRLGGGERACRSAAKARPAGPNERARASQSPTGRRPAADFVVRLRIGSPRYGRLTVCATVIRSTSTPRAARGGCEVCEMAGLAVFGLRAQPWGLSCA